VLERQLQARSRSNRLPVARGIADGAKKVEVSISGQFEIASEWPICCRCLRKPAGFVAPLARYAVRTLRRSNFNTDNTLMEFHVFWCNYTVCIAFEATRHEMLQQTVLLFVICGRAVSLKQEVEYLRNISSSSKRF
jgi:hypothetical protein